jgi:hypothetical protein
VLAELSNLTHSSQIGWHRDRGSGTWPSQTRGRSTQRSRSGWSGQRHDQASHPRPMELHKGNPRTQYHIRRPARVKNRKLCCHEEEGGAGPSTLREPIIRNPQAQRGGEIDRKGSISSCRDITKFDVEQCANWNFVNTEEGGDDWCPRVRRRLRGSRKRKSARKSDRLTLPPLAPEGRQIIS